MPSEWIDFRELRKSARIVRVLRAYSIELKVKGDRATGICPLPGHEGARKNASFSVHLAKGLFNCFSCRRGGNAIDLVALLDRLDPKDPASVRKAALKLASICGVSTDSPATVEADAVPRETPRPTAAPKTPEEAVVTPDSTSVLVNPPLDFQLQKLEPMHPYFVQRGFMAATVKHFGLGFCARGMLTGRIAIPLHDSDSRLIGYAGRLVDDAAIDADYPKYLFPGERTKDGVKRVFAKSRFLYNGHRLNAPLRRLVIVEGFPSIWWLWQNGVSCAVALMGCDCSDEQAAQIVRLVDEQGLVVSMLDGDPAGVRGTEKLMMQIAPHRAVRSVCLHDGRQPTDLTADELKDFIPHID